MSASYDLYYLRRLKLVAVRDYLARIRHAQILANYNETGIARDDDGFDEYGYDEYGYDRYGFNADAVDRAGVERWRFYGWGEHREPTYRDLAEYHRIRANENGIATGSYLDDDGYDYDGYNDAGYDREGFSRYGYDRRGNIRPPEFADILDYASPYADLMVF